ncbi:unnamed protein product, partial [Aphanomyces euteiches]
PVQDSPVMLAHQGIPMDSALNDLRVLQVRKGGREGKKQHSAKQPNYWRGNKTNQRGKPSDYNMYGKGGRRHPGGKQPSFSKMQEEASSP